MKNAGQLPIAKVSLTRVFKGIVRLLITGLSSEDMTKETAVPLGTGIFLILDVDSDVGRGQTADVW